MSIATTSIFGLEMPTYLHDGEEAVDAMNSNMGRVEALLNYILVSSLDGTPITCRLTAQYIVARIAIS